MRFKLGVLAPAAVLGLIAATPSLSLGQPLPESIRVEAVEVLRHAPRGELPGPEWSDTAFVGRTQDFLKDLPAAYRSEIPAAIRTPESVLESVQALEILLASPGDVTVRIISTPDHLPVTYRRSSDPPSGTLLSAITDTTRSVAPTYWTFWCTDPNTGRVHEQTQDCSKNCTAEFVF
jgi:hypothetical protein